MRKILIVTYFCLASIVSFGQNTMSVKGFRLLERDLTALNKNIISPQDGRAAALIKVVTTETDFNFDGGTYSLVGNPEYKKGEIWIYVPSRASKLTIQHSRFGVLRDYNYPIPIESGRTYELLLDLGVGKYVTIQTEVPYSNVFLDGVNIGVSPVYNMYILYGKHSLTASNDKMEGLIDIDVLKDGNDDVENVTVPMKDQSAHFGDVEISTDKEARIFINGLDRGIGTWKGELREGDYVVETTKDNCDNAKTSIHIEPLINNIIKAAAPTPHVGYLKLYTRPMGVIVLEDKEPLDISNMMELPIGRHELTFNHKGYISQSKVYVINRNENINDTIYLDKVQYLRKNSFYFGGSYVLGQLSGVAGHIGATIRNIDIQASYMFGTTKTEAINFYNHSDVSFISKTDYTLNSLSAKIGYQFALASKFGFVPQVGYSVHSLKCNIIEGTTSKGDGAACTCLTLGGKFVWSPVQHFCIFAAPEYDIAMKQDAMYEAIATAADFNAGGFFCHLGMFVKF